MNDQQERVGENPAENTEIEVALVTGLSGAGLGTAGKVLDLPDPPAVDNYTR